MKKGWLAPLTLALALGCAACALPERDFSVTPKGGYVETAVNTPGGYLLAFFPHPDGSLDYLSTKDAGDGAVHSQKLLTHFFSPDGGATWEEQETDGWMREIARICQVGMLGEEPPDADLLDCRTMDMDDARNIYLAMMDGRGAYRLLTVSPEGEAGEISVPEWADGFAGYKPGRIQRLRVDGKRVGVAFRRSPVVLSPGSPHFKSVFRRLDEENIHDAAFTGANILVATSRELIVYSAENGDELRRLQPPMRFEDDFPIRRPMAAGNDGAVYFASRYGVDRLTENGTVFETMLTDERYRFVGENVDVDDIWYVSESDTFYIRFAVMSGDTDTGRLEMCRYTYDPEYAPEG